MRANWLVSRIAGAVLTLALGALGASGTAGTAGAAGAAGAWRLPEDNGTMNKAQVEQILGANDYAETTRYAQKTEFIDFNAYGGKFTQVFVRLDPEKPRLYKGKKIVVVAGEAGSEYSMDFIESAEGKEGMGPWLAKRGITFIALSRVGRWNFLAADGTGSWKDVPLGQRMPMFNRDQKAHWPAEDFVSQPILSVSSPTASEFVRVQAGHRAVQADVDGNAGDDAFRLSKGGRARGAARRAQQVAAAVLGNVDRWRFSLAVGKVCDARRLSRLGYEQHGAGVLSQPREDRQVRLAV